MIQAHLPALQEVLPLLAAPTCVILRHGRAAWLLAAIVTWAAFAIALFSALPAGEPPWDPAERERLIRAKAAELVDAGATRVREETYGEDFGHIVMLDPEGNEFCVG